MGSAGAKLAGMEGGNEWRREDKAAGCGSLPLCCGGSEGGPRGAPRGQDGGGRGLRAPRFKIITWEEPDCCIMGTLLIAF